MNDDRQEIERLLRELTEWRRASGFDPAGDNASTIASTGEANAAMQALIAKLAALGARYHYCAARAAYRIDQGGVSR